MKDPFGLIEDGGGEVWEPARLGLLEEDQDETSKGHPDMQRHV